MEPTPTTPENFFQDMLSASVAEARENGQIVSSPHEAYALLSERLDAFWHGVRLRREPEVLLDLLVALAPSASPPATTSSYSKSSKKITGRQSD